MPAKAQLYDWTHADGVPSTVLQTAACVLGRGGAHSDAAKPETSPWIWRLPRGIGRMTGGSRPLSRSATQTTHGGVERVELARPWKAPRDRALLAFTPSRRAKFTRVIADPLGTRSRWRKFRYAALHFAKSAATFATSQVGRPHVRASGFQLAGMSSEDTAHLA